MLYIIDKETLTNEKREELEEFLNNNNITYTEDYSDNEKYVKSEADEAWGTLTERIREEIKRIANKD